MFFTIDAMQHVHMQAAHCKHIVNRDVQPTNLMYAQSTIWLIGEVQRCFTVRCMRAQYTMLQLGSCNSWHKS